MKKNYLQLPQTSITLAVLVFVIVLLFWGCNEVENVAPLYNKTFSNVAVPELVSVSPADSAFAGVDEITITGHNFPTSPSEMAVYFNTINTTILSADTNKIVVKAPNLVKDTINIKISKFTAERISNIITYKLISATKTIKEFSAGNRPYMITLDNTGNLYYNSTRDNVSEGIIKITPAGIASEYAKKGGETFYSSLKFAKADGLLGARKVTAIFKVAEGVAPVTFVSGFSKTIIDFDYDSNGSIWAVSTQDQIYRINPATKDKKTFVRSGQFRTCRVFNNYLYAAGQKSTTDNSEMVWRYQIVNADSIGPAEVYFEFTSAGYSSATIQGITFSQDGFLYIGNDGVEPIIIVNPNDKSSAPLFPGVLNPTKKNKLVSLFWGEGYFLYYVRQIINTDDKTAPLPLSDAIVKVNTRKLGAPYLGNN